MAEKKDTGAFKMKNMGIFYENIRNKIYDRQKQKKAESDPYKQWNIDEQIKLLTQLLREYELFMKE